MMALGWQVDSKQCDTKFKSLNKKFKEVKDHNKTSGNARRTWTFYDVSWLYVVSFTITATFVNLYMYVFGGGVECMLFCSQHE